MPKDIIYILHNFPIPKCYDVSRPNIGAEEGESRRKRKLLVTIHAFAIMPNHYHLLLSPLSERAVFFFMKKLNGGYARYFNQKYERKGRLFQSAFKSILVEHESHFIHLPYYIHCNRLDAAFPGWRKRELDNPTAAIGHLNKDRWSSHKDFMGEKNFPSVTQRDFLLEYFGGTEGYKENMKSWLESFSENKIGGLNLE